MERIRIGIITKPQALKGEFRLKPDLLSLKEYKKINSVFIDNNEYNVEKVTLRDTFVIFKVSGIDTCEQAEKLRNKEMFACIELDTSDNFNLKNFSIILNNKKIGVITDINNYGSKDILSISGDRNIMLPLIENLIVSTDNNKKEIVLDKDLFEQIAVYED